MNAIQTFNFQSQSVRVEFKKGEPLFCLTDVAEILLLKNANPTRFNLKNDGVHKMYSVDSKGRKNEITFISEPNLYRVIFRSNKTEAVKFQDWIFEEVIPQIRKTGGYQIPPKPTKALPNGLTAEQIETVKKLHNALVKSAPKEQQAKIAITLWSAVKSKFGVSYKEVPAEQFAEVLSVMSRVAVDKGVLYGEVLEKQPAPQGVVLTERQMGHFAAGAYMLDLATRRLADLSEPLKMLGARDKGVSAWTIRDEAEIWIKNCRSALEAVLPQMGDNFFRGSVQESLRMMDALAAR